MPTLHIQLLGDVLLRSDDIPITTVNTPRMQALLAYLMLHRQAPQPRQQVAFRLWPESSEAQARTNLRNLVHLFRRALPAADRFLHADGPMLQWRSDAPWSLDLADFERALALAAHSAEPAAARAALERAIGHYRGDLLPNCYDDWIIPERERLRQLALEALDQLILLLEAQQAYAPAIRYAQRLLRHDPLYEATYRHLMRLHALSGDRAGALRVYQTCVAVLEREIGSEPAPETCALYQQLARGELSAPAPPAAAVPQPAARHNLPALLTSFVGRTRELHEVTLLLAKTRLLTLTGAAGCGKTRLALAAAGELLTTFKDGVWLVELAPLTNPALVPAALATALHLREAAQQSLIAMIAEALQAKELLILLDNCEHLVAAAAQLAQTLLNSCPRLHILATSREALGVAGESTWLVPSLATPKLAASGAAEAVSALLSIEAVQLFVERAATALPTFTLTEANAPAVAQICRRLDGIPLALELAAARVKVLAVAQIAERLDDCFRLLANGSRTALHRHQTLRAAIDWSYQLLPAQEQLLLGRLAAFAGGWTLTAAETICSDTTILASDVLELLAHLVDKSLVVVDTQLAGEARYHMLEIIQQYAWNCQVASGVADAIKRSHASYYLALAEAADAQLTGAQQVAWLERLATEHDNLRATLRWAIDSASTDLAARVGAALWRFWWMRGHLQEGRRWLEQVLEQAPDLQLAAAGAAIWAKVLQGAGVLADEYGDRVQALAQYERSLLLRRRLGDRPGIAATLNSMGVGAYYLGEYARAGMLLEESLLLRRALGDPQRIAVVLCNLGLVALDQGDHAHAQALFSEGLALDRANNDLSGVAIALNNLGAVAREQQDYVLAQTLFQQGLQLCQAIGYTHGIAECLEGLADVARAAGDCERAVRLLAATSGIYEAIHLSRSHGEQARYDRTLSAARSQLGMTTFDAAWAAGRTLTIEQALAEA